MSALMQALAVVVLIVAALTAGWVWVDRPRKRVDR